MTLCEYTINIFKQNFIPTNWTSRNTRGTQGIHPVGNIGREQGSFWWPLLDAYLTHPLYFWDLNSVFSVFF
ncbi:uncharacterized protein LOC143242730 isoform X3 [Tachypleus tridentatus]|uniref:uncharacterized protein LOC143242730 isoform X3 n=1 Tax=Tachypleus tridentatus TaxID=6853 RepID=UPI003FD62A1F